MSENHNGGTSPKYGASVSLAKLYEVKSRPTDRNPNGKTYFRGRLGAARVALLQTDEFGDDGAPIWNLIVQDAPTSDRPSSVAPDRRDHQRSNRT
jgi:hypothetical protein